jgi:formate dehydrogenase iron-sulfur subunit
MELNRRDFVKGIGGAAGVALCGQMIAGKPLSVRAATDELGMLIDLTKCVGCWWCYEACKRANGFPETTLPDPYDPPSLEPDTWSTLYVTNRDNKHVYRKQACMHCTDAACVEICPTGALSYNELGFVEYNRDICSGCGYCSQACPFEVPRLQRNQPSGMAIMDKCTFCAERVTQGLPTACSEACPYGAILFGKRDELIATGEARILELQQCDCTVKLYGAEELGGLHVMYIIDDTPEFWGLPADPEMPAAVNIRNAIKWLGVGTGAAAVAGFALNYLVSRVRISKGGK